MALPFDPSELDYIPLTEGCPLGEFTCGKEIVDRWLHEKAAKRHGRDCRVTTIFAPDVQHMVGFYALGFGISRLNRGVLPDFTGYDRFPSLRLEWLGVRAEYQGERLGTIIMGRVLSVCRAIIEVGHIPAMTLIPADERSEAFYRRIGFVPLSKKSLSEMVLPAKDIIEATAP